MENLTSMKDKGILAGNGKVKKILTAGSTVIDDLASEANHLFDYSRGLDAKSRYIEQNRLKNPLWNNAGLFDFMHNMTTYTPPQKQTGLVNPEALKFVLLLGAIGFAVYVFLPKQYPIQKKVLVKKIKHLKIK